MKQAIGWVVGIGFAAFLLGQGVTQEVPLGNVRGQVVLGENGKPLKGAYVTLTTDDAPLDEPLRPRYVETKADGTFSLSRVPAGTYEVEVLAKNHALPKTIVTITEGVPTDLKLNLKRGEDNLTLYSSQRVYTPGETPGLELHGFIVPDTLDVEVRRVNVEEIAKRGGLQEAISPLASAVKPNLAEIERVAPLVQRVQHQITGKDAEGAFIEPLQVPSLKEGFYWITCRSGKLRADTALNITNLALITKNAGLDTLCFATDLVSGKPQAGVTVSAQGPQGLVALGQTDKNGLLATKILSAENNATAVVAKKGNAVALVGLWAREREKNDLTIVGYTDRPVYRPGDTIRFRGVARREPGKPLPIGEGIDLELRDPDDNILATKRLETSRHGTFDDEFATSPEGKPGLYRIVCRIPNGPQGSIDTVVAAYRKPEYRVDVKPRGERFLLGQPAEAVVDCQYYFGGPVAGAKVKASIYRQPSYAGDGEYGESYGDVGSYGEEVEATTDAAGRAVIRFNTKGEGDPENYPSDFIYTIVASVADDAGKYFDGQGEVKVTRGSYAVSVDSDSYIGRPGESIPVSVKVADVIDTDKPIVGRAVTLEVGIQKWTRRSAITVPKATFTGTTGADGIAHFMAPLTEGGSVVLTARVDDEQDRSISAQGWLYVEGATGSDESPAPSLNIRLDKKQYAPGETARVLLQTDEPGGSALVTIQADTIRYQRVVAITSRTTMLTLPVKADYAPNVYVAAAYVRKKAFREDTQEMKVDRDDRALTVSVTPDRTDYRPGDEARLTVRTKDTNGKAAPAEVSVAVVDESIYAIREDDTDLHAMLNPHRYDQVQTLNSFPEIYLDGGDKGSANIPVRKHFEDTAAWMPTVWTGASGETTVTVKLPDNLTEWRATAIGVTDAGASGQIKSSFKARKPLMVRMSPPAFMVEGDHQEVAISVTNETGADADVHLDLAATGIQAEGDLKPQVRVANGATESVRLKLSSETPGEAVLTAKAWVDDRQKDGVEQRFEIAVHGRQKIDGGSGRAEPLKKFDFAVDPNAVADKTDLTIHLSPSLAGSIVPALNDLVDFPYGCVEQTMSRFMPSIIVGDALGKLGLSRPAISEKIPKIAADSVARLARMQHGDGGWGWWEYDESDPFMTALVLDGIDRAKTAGYAANGIKLDAALQWAANRVLKPTAKDSIRDRVYLAYVLLRNGRKAPGLEKVDLGRAGAAELATAALAFHAGGDETKANDVLRRMTQLALTGSEQVRFAPSQDESYGEEPNALALTALATLRPNDPMIPKIVSGLINRRKGNGWTSTRDTSYTLIGLTAVMVQTGELRQSASATVRLNGRELQTVQLDPANPDGATIVVPKADLKPGPLKIEVERTTGVVYATAELRQFIHEDKIEAVSSDPGLSILRTYSVLEPRQLEDGTMKLLPSLRPVSQVKAGDLVRVELQIQATTPREFLMIESPTPGNCRVTERVGIGEGETWSYWWSDLTIRDDRVAFFVRSLPKGLSKLTYTMRAEGVGVSRALPAHAEVMYDPSVRAATTDAPLEVTP